MGGLLEARLDRAEEFLAWSCPAPVLRKEAPSTRGALDRFFRQAPCSLFANDPVGDICSTYESPSRGLASHGPASPEEQDYLEPLPLNSWVCTTHHHHPETNQPQKGYPLPLAVPLGIGPSGLQTLPPSQRRL